MAEHKAGFTEFHRLDGDPVWIRADGIVALERLGTQTAIFTGTPPSAMYVSETVGEVLEALAAEGFPFAVGRA